jgi:hypothetical protein
MRTFVVIRQSEDEGRVYIKETPEQALQAYWEDRPNTDTVEVLLYDATPLGTYRLGEERRATVARLDR